MSNATLTKFEVRARNLGFVDHTYVYCPEIRETFTCFVMSGTGDRLIAEGMGYYDVANLYRLPQFPFNDTAGIIYGITGVCHQAANRFLLATNPHIQIPCYFKKPAFPPLPPFSPFESPVLGYWLSATTYGVLGTDFANWMKTKWYPSLQKILGERPQQAQEFIFDEKLTHLVKLLEEKKYLDAIFHSAALQHPIATAQTMYAKQTEAGKEPSENDITSIVAAELASPIIHQVKPEKLKEEIAGMLNDKDKIIESGMRGEEMANKINESVGVLTKSLASQLSDSEYRNLIGAQKGEEVLVVDPEIAAKCSP